MEGIRHEDRAQTLTREAKLKVLVKPQEQSLRRLPPLRRPCAKSLGQTLGKMRHDESGHGPLTWSYAKMVELELERFSAVVSDGCACFMRFKGRLDHL